MRSDYSQYLLQFQCELSKVGVSHSVAWDSELTAFLELGSGWILIFDCERYYGPAFTVSIAPTIDDARRGKSYTLRLLMKIFESKTGKKFGPPTFENEAKFLASEQALLFGPSDFYSAEYKNLNETF